MKAEEWLQSQYQLTDRQAHDVVEQVNGALADERDRLQAIVDELPKWEAMETAPRDGTEVILAVERRAGMSGRMLVGHYMPGGHCIEDHPPINEGWYFWNGRMFDKAAKPIAWQPLPRLMDAGPAGREGVI